MPSAAGAVNFSPLVRPPASSASAHVNAVLLAEQEAYYNYFDRYISWLNFEIRTRAGALSRNILPKPKRIKKPRLKLK